MNMYDMYANLKHDESTNSYEDTTINGDWHMYQQGWADLAQTVRRDLNL